MLTLLDYTEAYPYSREHGFNFRGAHAWFPILLHAATHFALQGLLQITIRGTTILDEFSEIIAEAKPERNLELGTVPRSLGSVARAFSADGEIRLWALSFSAFLQIVVRRLKPTIICSQEVPTQVSKGRAQLALQ
jgi:hypothetical protein